MTRRLSVATLVTFGIAMVLALVAVLPGSTRAAGGPPSVYSSAPHGIVSPNGGSRYVALSISHGSVVAEIATNGGRVLDLRSIRKIHNAPDSFEIPSVAGDRSPGGLSADGRVLVLGEPFVKLRQPKTTFMILKAHGLDSPHRITLDGAFTFDAISPNGTRLYLTQYQSNFDPTHYAVRTYDISQGQLLRKPVIDPTEPEEQMRGFPVTRAMSPNGRWAYTLYDGAGGTPFIHALDTAKATARCIDLDPLADLRGISRLNLQVSANGETLGISDDRTRIAAMDTRSFAVTAPLLAATASDGSGGGPSWVVFALAGLGAVVIAAAVRAGIRRRRRVAAT